MRKVFAKTTIYSLGRDLDVSPATVSKALRGSAEISVELRKKINKVAQERGFKPRVVSRKVPNICVLIQQYPGHLLDLSPFISAVMEGVAQYTSEEGLEMSIYADNIDKLNQCDIVREFRRRSIDGAIVLRSTNKSSYFSALEAEGFPYYALLGSAKTDKIISVNNVDVGYRATKYLIDKGHRLIGVLVGSPHGRSGADRFCGYKKALNEAGIPIRESLVFRETSDYTGLEFGCNATSRLIEQNPGITAVFTMDHNVAVGALNCFYRKKLFCPADISLISCDDYPETAFMQPPLTVVDIPNRELGYLAAKQVFRTIRGLAPFDIASKVDLSGNIIERESTDFPRRLR